MPTLLGLPAASSPNEADKLWLTQGTGTDRDRQVQAGDLIAGSMASVVSGFATAGSLSGSEVIPLLQTSMKKATIDTVDRAAFPRTVEALTSATSLVGTEHVVVRTALNTAKKAPVSSLFQHAIADNATTTLVKFDNGSDSLLSVDGSAVDSIQIMADPTYRFVHTHASLNLAGKSSSSSNTNPVDILLDLNGEFPSSAMGSLGIRGTAHASIGVSPLYKSYGVLAIRDTTVPPALYYRLLLYDMGTGAAITWATLAPTNGLGFSLEIDVFGTKAP